MHRITAADATHALAGCEGLDPRGLMTAADIAPLAMHGECFAIDGQAAHAVYVVHVINGTCWVDALKGAGDTDITALVDAVLCDQANGLHAIALQTRRRGLVRLLQRLGYHVTGWVLRKELVQ